MLSQASKDYFYKLYVLHSHNISAQSQQKLQESIREFPNASLEFIDKGSYYDALWEGVGNKSHFSKDVFYKLSIASSFPSYQKVLVTDVDVVWRGDISRLFSLLALEEDYYIGGFDAPLLDEDCPLRSFMRCYEANWSSDEIKRMVIGGGLLVCNLDKIRKDGLEARFMEFLASNASRLLQAEQDVLNMVCYPKIKLLSKNGMVSTYFWEIYDRPSRLDGATWRREDIELALCKPVQVHYAGRDKPWRVFNTMKANWWFEALAKTDYLDEWLDTTYKDFYRYKSFYDTYASGEVFPPFKRLLRVGRLFELSKRRGILRVRILNIKLYLDFSWSFKR